MNEMAELCAAFDRPADFPPRFVQAAELAQGIAEIIPHAAFVHRIADFDIPFRASAGLRRCEGLEALASLVQ
jgi:hypothetical protein